MAPSALPGIDMLDALTRLGGNRALARQGLFRFLPPLCRCCG
ncbi:MAG: hypothetical protein WDN69_30690 [Aliidongia sp.]